MNPFFNINIVINDIARCILLNKNDVENDVKTIVKKFIDLIRIYYNKYLLNLIVYFFVIYIKLILICLICLIIM